MNGVIVVNKEQDYTSFDVCALMRGILKTRKVGHGGTLDPKAEGVLPVFIGCATKLCDVLPDDEKEYEAEMTLGLRSDTEDIWGIVTSSVPVELTERETEETVMSFIGEYEQVPPMYSAKKLNGRKLYELAREGTVVERKPEHVRIREIRILSMDLPRVRFSVKCSKGTYIRSLCRDIGDKLGCGAVMSALRRTRHGQFTLQSARTVKEIETMVKAGRGEELLIPVRDLFPEAEILTATGEGTKALLNGNLLTEQMILHGVGDSAENEKRATYRVLDCNGRFRGLYERRQEENILRPLKMFLDAE